MCLESHLGVPPAVGWIRPSREPDARYALAKLTDLGAFVTMCTRFGVQAVVAPARGLVGLRSHGRNHEPDAAHPHGLVSRRAERGRARAFAVFRRPGYERH